MSKRDIKRILKEAIKIYNMYRRPEAEAEILGLKKDSAYIKFTGSFCKTCGANDWVEDFAYVLKDDFKMNAKLIKIVEPSNSGERCRIGVFKIG